MPDEAQLEQQAEREGVDRHDETLLSSSFSANEFSHEYVSAALITEFMAYRGLGDVSSCWFMTNGRRCSGCRSTSENVFSVQRSLTVSSATEMFNLLRWNDARREYFVPNCSILVLSISKCNPWQNK